MILTFGGVPLAGAQPAPPPLPPETVPANASLPDAYPQSWVFVHDLNTDSILDGRVAVVDVASGAANLKGQIRAAQFAAMVQSKSRGELYVAETFYSRLTRGERTDALTIYDPATLREKGEVVLPPKRYQVVTLPNTFRLTGDESRALVFNFTPAASVTVVDLIGRKVLGEVDLPGCSLVYPIGQQSFFTLCANGGLTAIKLDAGAGIAAQKDVAPFNDIDKDPMFMIPARAGATYYFATFNGNIRPIVGDEGRVSVQPAFSLLSADEDAQRWRPAGWQVVTADDAGRLYVLLRKGAKEGDHKSGGSRVRIVDPATHDHVLDIELQTDAGTIEVTHGPQPLLIAATITGDLDVYDAATGKLVRTIGDHIVHKAMIIQAVR
ncbi:amine dehydrogenase large subunit [Caulobacter sp. KR2-114]|uniref:amine dehydrogenase large subunit n=1 Tax=Caulobacter sp. KR2-114 TaxID=3400912 RepID=UPI003C0F702E